MDEQTRLQHSEVCIRRTGNLREQQNKSNQSNKKTDSDFDYPAFLTYCDSIDKAPEEAIADIITSDFLTPRFPTYAEKRRKHFIAHRRESLTPK